MKNDTNENQNNFLILIRDIAHCYPLLKDHPEKPLQKEVTYLYRKNQNEHTKTTIGKQLLFYLVFLSKILAIHRIPGEDRRPYSFLSTTFTSNIETFACIYAFEIIMSQFQPRHMHLKDCFSKRIILLEKLALIEH